jgi:sperm-associated antigen 16 protein
MQVLRGHADSVNEVQWLPYTNTLASASSDKTISLWDARTGLAAATFFNHSNSVNSVAASLDSRTLASVDADGTLKVWDVRAVAERGSTAVSTRSLNRVRFDAATAVALAACDDGRVYLRSVPNLEPAGELSGHDDAVQSLAVDYATRNVITGSSDCTFRLWA